jgi:hypothetical protein
MTKRYKQVRFPEEVYPKLILKKREMEATLSKLTNRPVRLPITKVFKAVFDHRTECIDNDYLLGLQKKRRKRR